MTPEDVSSLNSIGLLVLFGTGFMMLALPRRYALLPIIFITCFMTLGQVVVIAGLHFTMMRIVLLFGWIRVLLRGEVKRLQLNAIDRTVLAWMIIAIITHSLLWQTSEEFINRLGFGYNVAGFYFLFRFLLHDLGDIKRVFAMTAVVIMPLAAAMLLERATERNVFAVFGGVRPVSELRGDTLRCQGPFGHPILAGTFGAALLPFFASLWWQGRKFKWLAIAGTLSSAAITATAGSSGPLMAFMAACFAMALWRCRRYMRLIRWGAFLAFISLALVMKAPVWYLIQRVNIFSGSTGDHRALLIDMFVRHFSDWWLLGTKSTISWADENMWDITNQYIWEGVNGGLLTLILFVLLIALCFRAVGRTVRRLLRTHRREEWREAHLVWALGACLFAHTVSFISISYFDQNVINWYMLLAMTSTAVLIRKTAPATLSRKNKSAVSKPILDLSADMSNSQNPESVFDRTLQDEKNSFGCAFDRKLFS